MGLIRTTFSMALLGLFVLIGFTVPIGERTLFSHVSNIWGSNEAQELVEGVKDSSGPLVDRLKRGVEAGLSDEENENENEAPNSEEAQEQAPASEGPASEEPAEQLPLATNKPASKQGDTTQ